MNGQVQRASERAVSAAKLRVAYVRVTPIDSAGGLHVGLAHTDNFCTYLAPHCDNHSPKSRIIPVSGPILAELRICAKCAGAMHRSGVGGVEFCGPREIQPNQVLLLGPFTLR